MLHPRGHTLLRVWNQKDRAVQEWRAALLQDASTWLADRLPGSFQKIAPNQVPSIELLLTGQLHPWESVASPAEVPEWAGVLDLGGWLNEYWQCTDYTSLRLAQRRSRALLLTYHNCLVLAGVEDELLSAPPVGTGGSDLAEALWMLELSLPGLLARWSLTAFLRELEGQMVGIQDAAERASNRRSPRGLSDMQRQIIQVGIDSRIVVNDIVQYAGHPAWSIGVLEFSETGSSDGTASSPITASLTDSLRQEQITDGRRVSQMESDLRDILSTSAELTAGSENLRLQRRIAWLTAISLAVAVFAAIVAVVALRHSNSPPIAPAAHTKRSSITPRPLPSRRR